MAMQIKLQYYYFFFAKAIQKLWGQYLYSPVTRELTAERSGDIRTKKTAHWEKIEAFNNVWSIDTPLFKAKEL